MRMRVTHLGAAILAAALAPQAFAQAPPAGGHGGGAGGGAGGNGGLPPGMPMPSHEQIAAQVHQVMQASPEETIELPGVCKITYKKVPTDPQRVAQLLGRQMGQGLPAGVDMDQVIGMFLPQITELLNQELANLGKIEALVELKIGSKRIPVGEHRLGIQFDGERPKAMLVSSEAIGAHPIEVRLKTRAVEMQPELKIEFKPIANMAAGAEKFDLQLTFMRFEAKSKTKLERAAGGAAHAPAAGGDDDKDGKEGGN